MGRSTKAKSSCDRLKPSQRDFVNNVSKHMKRCIDKNISGIYMKSPATTGKTRMSREVANAYEFKHKFVIYVADSGAQAKNQCNEVGAAESLGALTFGQLKKKAENKDGSAKSYTVCVTPSSARKLLSSPDEALEIANAFGKNWFIIIDEAHKMFKYKTFVNKFNNTNMCKSMSFFFLLMSATPRFDNAKEGRTQKRNVTELFKCNNELVHTEPYFVQAPADMKKKVRTELNCVHPEAPTFKNVSMKFDDDEDDYLTFIECCIADALYPKNYEQMRACERTKALMRLACSVETHAFCSNYDNFIDQFDDKLRKALINGKSTTLGNSAFVVIEHMHGKELLLKSAQDTKQFDVFDLSECSTKKVGQRLREFDDSIKKKGENNNETPTLAILAPRHLTSTDVFTGRACSTMFAIGNFDKEKKYQMANRFGRTVKSNENTPIHPKKPGYTALHFKVDCVQNALLEETFDESSAQRIFGDEGKAKYKEIVNMSDEDFFKKFDEELKRWIPVDEEEHDDKYDEEDEKDM